MRGFMRSPCNRRQLELMLRFARAIHQWGSHHRPPVRPLRRRSDRLRSCPLHHAWTAIFFFASTAASTAYLTSGELFPLEIRALAFAVVFAGSMGVGGVLSPWLFDLVVNVKSPTMIACVYAFAAVLMIVVAIAVAPMVWQRRRRPVVILPPYQIPSRDFPELSRKPVEATVRPISAA
jgi:MFS family permease